MKFLDWLEQRLKKDPRESITATNSVAIVPSMWGTQAYPDKLKHSNKKAAKLAKRKFP